MAKKSVEDSPVFELSEEQIWLAEQKPTGFLVALWLDPETASKLALKGGEAAEALHITLAYCGSAEEMGPILQSRAIVAIDEAVRYWSQPTGKIAGYGRFNASESSDGKDVFYATPDIPQLAYLRERIVSCLSDQGVAVSQNHGYTPHITLAYLDSGAANPVDKLNDLELKFSSTTIMIGDTRIDIPFWTEVEATISMSESTELPVDAPLDAVSVRAMLGDFQKEWIPFLPKPGNYFRNGESLGLTSTDYDQMLANFHNRVFKQDLPIRSTHMPSDGGSIGYIKDMRLADDGSIEVKPEWNELGQGLVDGDRFRHVSAEYCKTWTNPVTLERIPNVAVGLALVPLPHFKTDVLRPLSSTEAMAFAAFSAENHEVLSLTLDPSLDITLSSDGVFTSSTTIPLESVSINVSDGTSVTLSSSHIGEAEKGTTVSEEEKKAAEEVAKLAQAAEVTEPVVKPAESFIPTGQIVLNDLQQVIMTAAQREKERIMFQDLSTRVELAERRTATAEAEVERMKNERRKEKFTAEVTGHSAENGVAWFGSIEDNVKQLISLAQAHGDDSSEVRWTITQKRNEAQAIRNTGLFEPLSLSQSGETASSIESQVRHLADQLMAADKTLTPEQAMNRVYQENPEFYTKGLNRK